MPTTQPPHTIWDNMNSTTNTLKYAETATISLLRDIPAKKQPKRFIIRSNYKNGKLDQCLVLETRPSAKQFLFEIGC